jgi:hypothetical protein
MFKSLISKSILAICCAALLPPLVGCSAGSSDADQRTVSGVMSLPLLASENGHNYRLSNAYVYISGPQYAQLSSSGDPNETTLSATLVTGSYTAHLYNWNLERDDGDGTFRPVQASLISSVAVPFSVLNGTTTTVSYRFSTDGVIVTVGSGELEIALAVDESSATCTPFADDCAEGTWCPPTGLTGAPRACVPAGLIGLAQPCSAPSDCVANASCFDQGDGPVCAQLCPADAFELACASGGTCKAADAEYGVCRPTPAE